MTATTTTLWCYIEGEHNIFSVSTSPDHTIDDVTKQIYDEQFIQFIVQCSPSDVTLTKVDANYNEETQRMIEAGTYQPAPNDRKLNRMKLISDIWERPPDRHIHVFVRLSSKVGSRTLVYADDRRPGKRARLSDPFDEENTVAGGWICTRNVTLDFIGGAGSTLLQHTLLHHTPPKLLAEVVDTTHRILQRYRPAMRTLRDGHIEMLGIPSVRGMPSLLLHDLGSNVVSQQQAKYIANVFSLYDHTVLINTSGSGKTRIGLQGLCQNWGFYGVVKQAPENIGSGDFWQLMASLDGSLDYRYAKLRGIRDGDAALHMHEKAQHRVLQFLLARFLFLNLLISEASECEGGLRPSDHRLLWVLLQARPTDLLEKDAFKELADALWMASLDQLKMQINEEYLKLKDTLEVVKHPVTGELTRRPLYCLLDEIQIAATIRMGEYRSDDTDRERPLLRPIWQSMTEVLSSEEMLVILSGTAINESSLRDVLESSAFTFKRHTVVRDIGAFDDPDAQSQYIQRYLPYEQSAAKQDFLKRAWGWCRGRYRSTAKLIVLVLMAGPNSPHKILNNFVESSTNFLPTDGEKWCANESDVKKFDMEKMKEWSFDRLEPRQIEVLRDVVYSQIVYGSYTLKPFAPKAYIEAFIEHGIARTNSNGGVIDEPLAIMAVWNWLSEKGLFSLLDCLRRDVGQHAPRKKGFEAYIAFYMHKVFGSSARLNDVFTFRSDFARRKDLDLAWQKEEFELVTVSTPAGTDQPKISVVTSLRGPSSNIGLLAKTDDEVLDWISENQGCYAFCFATESAGPDLFFYVRSKATRKLLLVALQAKHYEDVDKSTLIHGVRTVTPSFFWTSKDGKVSNRLLVVASHFRDALMKIEHSITVKDADYPVLRIFASYPADAKLDRTQDLKGTKSQAKADEDSADVTDPDPHPLAALRLDNFQKISDSLAETWYRNSVKEMVVNFAEDQYDEVQV